MQAKGQGMADKQHAIMETPLLSDAIRWQAEHCLQNSAPITARICLGLLAMMQTATATGRRIANWQGLVLADAMPLRIAGGLHHVHLTGADDRLAAIYAGEITDQADVDARLCAILHDHDAALLPWLDGPPQTNEAGRSASIMAALMYLSGRLGPKFELNEIGASAGANTMIDRYAYNLGGVMVGPQTSPVVIKPEWRGPPPPQSPVDITAISGCDQAVIDLADPAAALRLKSYCWPENHARLARLDQISAMARAKPPQLTEMDAGDWVDQMLLRPQADGVTRVLYHSIVWQYIPNATRARIEAVMAAAGAKATREKPLAWIMLETNRATFRHELRVRYWPDGGDWALLGQAHAHGAWAEWYGV
jgi:hypothetical protein